MDIEVLKNKQLISNSKNAEAIESEFLKLPQEPCPVTHRFGPGIYMREVFLPAGSIVIGHHHNFEHMNIFLKGKITFFKDDGAAVEMTAPMTLMGKPGRKIAYIHEDSIWVNVFSTTETNVEKLEAHFLTKSEVFRNDLLERQKIGLLTTAVDKKDFSLAMKEYGWTEEKVRQISEDTSDMIDLPYGNYKIKTGPSKIEGTGLFATADIEASEIIAPARIMGKRTIAGRYTNHSLFPNARMVRGKDSDIDLVATKKISGCHGGQDGEEITINYRESLQLTLEVMEAKCQL
jgi:hypothetical protein